MGWAGFSRTLSSRGVECRAGRGSCETTDFTPLHNPLPRGAVYAARGSGG